MGLPTTSDIKRYLRIENDAEDNLIKDLIEEAIGLIETSTGKSLTSEDVIWIDDAVSGRSYGYPTALMIKKWPVDVSTIVVKGASGDVVAATNYTIDGQIIRGTSDFAFDDGPYTITAKAGYAASPSYQKRELPVIRMLVIDVTAFLFQQRTPGALGEGSSGASVNYSIDPETGLPDRIAKRLRKMRGIIIA